MSSTVNNGNQILTFDYKQEGTSEGFDKIMYKIIPKGIIEGGELEIVGDRVSIKPFVSFFEDDEIKVGVRLETTDEVLVLPSITNNYIIGDFEWQNVANNYMDFKCVPFTDLQPHHFIFGKVLYNGNTIIGFDTSKKTWSRNHYDNFSGDYPNFYVMSSDTNYDKFIVCKGKGIINSKKVELTENTLSSSINFGVTNSRKDLIVINENSEIEIIQGIDSENPIIPKCPLNKLMIGILTVNNNSTFSTEYIYNINPCINVYTDKHDSITDEYGLGTTEKYGHNKVVDNLNSEEYIDGEALSAHQGKVLKDSIDSSSQDLSDLKDDVEVIQQEVSDILDGTSVVGKANKDDLGNKISSYYEKKGNIIEFVENLPQTNIEDRLYAVPHSYTTTETKTTTVLDILGSYTTLISNGKYSVDSIFEMTMDDHEIGSFFVSDSVVSIYMNRDCTGLIDYTGLTLSSIKTWTIETTINHSDIFAYDKNNNNYIKIANVDQVEDFFIRKDQKGSAGGVATLDSNGKIPLEELSFSTLVYMGVSSDFVTDIGNISVVQKGMFFISGTTQIYEDITYNVSDWIIYNGESWERSVNSSAVSSVNGKIGEVVLTSEDINISPTNTKSIKSAFDDKQDTLVSGTNIKTINGESILESGNLDLMTKDESLMLVMLKSEENYLEIDLSELEDYMYFNLLISGNNVFNLSRYTEISFYKSSSSINIVAFANYSWDAYPTKSGESSDFTYSYTDSKLRICVNVTASNYTNFILAVPSELKPKLINGTPTTSQTRIPKYFTNAYKSYLATNDSNGNQISTYYQQKLTSGTNIKTINGDSILGSGNLDIKVDLPMVQIDRVNYEAQKSAGTLSPTTLYVVYDLN